MSETHPNALLQEANEKRAQSNALAQEAEALELRAKALLGEDLNEPEDEEDSEQEPTEGKRYRHHQVKDSH